MGEARDAFEAALAAVLAKHVAGFEALRAAERLSGGASQETYRIVAATRDGERQFALRRAPGGVGTQEHGGPGLATEALLMRAARDAGVPEPEVVAVLEPGDGLGEGFVMEWLEGEALGARVVRAPEFEAVRPGLARQCGEILARIHAIDLDASGLADRLATVTPETFVRQTWERYRAYPTPQPMIDYTARWLLDHLPQAPRTTLVHNDFRTGNFMLTADGINAVLDWELAHRGDPMRDLGWLCTNSWRFGHRDLPVGGFGEREDLFRGYEAVSGVRVDPEHVRFWEVFGSFWWAIGCLSMAEHYRHGPDQTVERPAIGRRSSECQVDCVNLLIPGPVELLAADPGDRGIDMPRADELLGAVRDFLRGDVMQATRGRTHFMARVAANALDVVARELELGPPLRARERERLRALYGAQDELETLRWRLVHELRDGSMPLDRPGLAETLREAVVNQVAIDQPRYSGFRHAVETGTTR
ncbi:MAG: phosphotransferase family protein [Myxococcota bacterium]|nr:phosphotransferase family protein [Myxococcota bacterium]